MATYRKTYLCICEGQQERMYFDHLAKLIIDFPKKVVKFKPVFLQTMLQKAEIATKTKTTFHITTLQIAEVISLKML